MSARKVYTTKFNDYEIHIVDSKAKEKGMTRSEYIRNSCFGQNECIGLNILEPLCLMRKDLEEMKISLDYQNEKIIINLIKKLEGSCDLLWKYVNL